MLKSKLTFVAILMFLSVVISYGQYSCGCGEVTTNSITLSPSGPGCNVSANVSITATTSACVNGNWTWNTTPAGSSGSVYVGYSNNGAVPFTTTTTLGFYMSVGCSTLGSTFINFTAPTGPCASVPLPISIKSIYQMKDNLIWEVETESNCSHYIVEGSYDAQTWEKIGEKECNNVLTPSAYSLQIGKNYPYLRLIQYDFDGQNSTSDVIKWKSSSSLIKNTNYGGKVIAQGENLILPQEITDQKGILNVFDIYGKKIYSGDVDLFDSSVLGAGHYLVNMQPVQSQESINLRLVIL